ncbi:MAG: replicative DNA helicase [Oceanicaulis sp.]
MTADPLHDSGPDEAADPFAPPHNIEAEQALLGALLFDNEVYQRVGDWLKPDHFYDPLHARIYETASQLIIGGSLADAVVLKSKFERDPGMAEIGGPVYLADLMREAPEPASATEYGRLIYDLALRRELIRFGEEVSHNAIGSVDSVPAASVLEEAERSLFALAETGGTQKALRPFHEALEESIAMASAAYQRGGGLSGISSGLRSLDAKLGGMHRSDLIILAGRPSMGKTSLATNIAFAVAQAYEAEESSDGQRKTKNGGVVAFFSLEMSQEQLATRLIADYSGISSYHIRQGKIDAAQFEDIRDAVAEINSIPLYIDDTGGISIGALTARARRLKRQRGLDMIVVDYLQLITGSGKTDSRVQEISEITQALKSLAKELNVPVIALSQLSRQVEQRDDKKPQLSDLRESGSIEQDADVVMFVYRESYYLERMEPKEGTEEHLKWEDEMREIRNQADVIIGKQRHGPIGSVKVAFDPERTKFSDLDISYQQTGFD